MAVRYNPNPARITEPLYKVEELEKSPLYTVLCGGKELTVYHTDSFELRNSGCGRRFSAEFSGKSVQRFPKGGFPSGQDQCSGSDFRPRVELPAGKAQ